jgi:hypothetical protein
VGYFAGTGIQAIGDIQVAGGIHGGTGWEGQLGVSGQAIVAAEPLSPVSCHQGQDRGLGIHPQNDVAAIREKDVARRVHRETVGAEQVGRRSRNTHGQPAASESRNCVVLAEGTTRN